MSLAQKTTTGILWNFAEQLSKRGIGIVVTLLLARFLAPDDYGLVAMMAVFLAIADSIMDLGFNQALIRKKEATDSDFSTAFYTNLALGGLSYLLLFISAPFIAMFYEEPRLVILVRVVGIVILINSFQIVQSAILSRNLNFKAQLKAAVPATFISGLFAVIMAYIGFGVWSLVAQMIISSLVLTVFLWSMNIWRPTFVFSKEALAEMFGFGSKIFLSGLLDTIFRNIYLVVIAKIFTATIAGHYFFASKIRDLILNQLVNSIQTVTYPALATLQEDDIRLKAGYRKIIQVTTFCLFPIMAIVAALAEPFFTVFLNDQWLPAVPYLQLMCISGLMQPLHSINLNILKVKGRSDLFLYLEIVKKVFIVVVLSISIQFGVIGILVGNIITSILSYLPNSYYSGQLINYPAREQIRDFSPGLLLSGFIALMVYFAVSISTMHALIELLFFGIIAFSMYLIASYAFKLEALKFARQLVKDKLRRNA
ncbi:lipopolysaccharide biosynthesis protein [Methanolobus bombayensis]|uniref:lipopolysaccharide biosynthesis protein n=1 Tax=Methanolobus bombayensis TaxID=38023 RepID=UPI001AEB94CC|nr:lipopolysaccharide biosynthesis protein [Methanolobus bombayensis]MBP1910301.1 O-antigen/teichoic acid export membrane protein [Methanolobus bombayensis]